jgi:hypothetical protein
MKTATVINFHSRAKSTSITTVASYSERHVHPFISKEKGIDHNLHALSAENVQQTVQNNAMKRTRFTGLVKGSAHGPYSHVKSTFYFLAKNK